MTETRTELLQIRMLPSVKDKLERLAAAEDRTMSKYLERLILDQPEPPKTTKPRRR